MRKEPDWHTPIALAIPPGIVGIVSAYAARPRAAASVSPIQGDKVSQPVSQSTTAITATAPTSTTPIRNLSLLAALVHNRDDD